MAKVHHFKNLILHFAMHLKIKLLSKQIAAALS
jgi:hypothetical protein